MRAAVTVLAFAGSASAAADATRQTLPAAGASVGGVLGSLLLVVALIVGLAWALRRLQFARTGGTQLIQVVAQLPLGPRERVVLVRIGEHQALLGVGPGGVTSLQLLDAAIAPVANAAAVPAGAGDPAALLGRMRELLERSRDR